MSAFQTNKNNYVLGGILLINGLPLIATSNLHCLFVSNFANLVLNFKFVVSTSLKFLRSTTAFIYLTMTMISRRS